ncbi:NFYB/HAP3 family transcription factor subunit [Candidatus Bathyarchaeota archaeon]|nr:NFYB/HAP3 family transcription factor subunit [Candidatus Bathyarchaeota archaeon]
MEKKEISTATIHRLILKGGAARVGDDAVEELRKILEDLAVKIGRGAWEIAVYGKRKTVKAGDVRLAARRFIKE